MGNTAVVFIPSTRSAAPASPSSRRGHARPVFQRSDRTEEGVAGADRHRHRHRRGDDQGERPTQRRRQAGRDGILNDKAQQDVSNILNDAAQSLKVIRKLFGDEDNQRKLADARGQTAGYARQHESHLRLDRRDAAEVHRAVRPRPAKRPSIAWSKRSRWRSGRCGNSASRPSGANLPPSIRSPRRWRTSTKSAI